MSLVDNQTALNDIKIILLRIKQHLTCGLGIPDRRGLPSDIIAIQSVENLRLPNSVSHAENKI